MASNSAVKGLLVELFCDMENILLNLQARIFKKLNFIIKNQHYGKENLVFACCGDALDVAITGKGPGVTSTVSGLDHQEGHSHS
jgi:hypothetical protein